MIVQLDNGGWLCGERTCLRRRRSK